MPADPLFLYGTLRHAPLYLTVSGTPLEGTPARLADHAVAEAHDPTGETLHFPLFTPRPGAVAEGLLVTPPEGPRARLDFYEEVFGYDPSPIVLETARGPVRAVIYLPRAEEWHAGADWDLGAWAARAGALTCAVAEELMALHGLVPPAQARRRYAMLGTRVSSRARAEAWTAPATLRRSPAPADVDSHALRRPYNDFFGVEESDLRFRRFDGSLSAPVTRAGFIMGDAVTVLPYDPVRRRVMVVEQFRYGPFARGDRNPWSLEPVAGRIDAGETPEEAARREAAEEAHLLLGALHPVSRYYVSPGAVTEYLFSYVGIADLPDGSAGIGGLASEAEDIRAHVIGLDRLMAMVESGEVENAPLLISALWLDKNCDKLKP